MQQAIRGKLKFATLLWLLLFAIRLPAQIDLHPVLPDGFGVNIHFTAPRPGELKMLAESGARWIRMDFVWQDTERAKGAYDFARYDTLLAALDPCHIRALFILDYYNTLYDGGLSPYTDEGRQAFARWAAAAASHFKGRGVLWEMYNEPNANFWKPKANTPDYIKLALAVGEAISRAAPHEAYIGPASADIDPPFLEDCFKGGLLNFWWAVSIHPYRQKDPETVADDYRTVRGLIDKYAPKGKQIPILAGEWGYSSAWNWKEANEESQGKFLVREWLTNQANDVPLTIWYDWHDDGADPKNPEHHFGMVNHQYQEGSDPVYQPKPAYLAARTLTTALGGFRFNKRLAVGGADDYVLLFTRPENLSDVRLAVWSTSRDPHQIVIPASPGHFRVTGWTGEAQPEVIATSSGLALSARDTPQYVAPTGPNALLEVAAAWERLPLEIRMPAPADVPIILRLRNPLALATRASNESGAKAMVPAGAEISLTTHAHFPERSLSPTSVRIEWEIAGLGHIAQETLLLATNPLAATPVLAASGALAIQVENLSAQPFTGSVSLTDVDGLDAETIAQPLEFKQGETVRFVRFGLRNQPQDYRVGIMIKDASGQTVLRVPASRFVAVDQLPPSTDGAPLNSYQIIADGDPKVASQGSLAISEPPGGPPLSQFGLRVGALRISYRFEAGWKFARVVPTRNRLAAISEQPKALAVWIYGDGQGNQPALRLADATGQVFQAIARPIIWQGWRYVVFPLDPKRLAAWGGAGDHVVHFPLHWDTLLLIDSAHHQQTIGILYLAAPTLIY